jgi:hypothetical protein
LHFGNDTVTTFNTGLYTFENAACVSDSNGNLQLSIGWQDKLQSLNVAIFENLNKKVEKSSVVRCNGSMAQGAFFLPIADGERYWVVYNAIISGSCGASNSCLGLFATIVSKTDSGYVVDGVNIDSLASVVDESVGVTRHANGRDWWVVCHKANDSGTSCNNSFYTILLSEGMPPIIREQVIGVQRCGAQYDEIFAQRQQVGLYGFPERLVRVF